MCTRHLHLVQMPETTIQMRCAFVWMEISLFVGLWLCIQCNAQQEYSIAFELQTSVSLTMAASVQRQTMHRTPDASNKININNSGWWWATAHLSVNGYIVYRLPKRRLFYYFYWNVGTEFERNRTMCVSLTIITWLTNWSSSSFCVCVCCDPWLYYQIEANSLHNSSKI